MHVIGSLAGYPLIKQAMNQGYDVIEFIQGHDIKPADYPVLESRFAGLPYEMGVDDVLTRFQQLIPMFRQLNALAFRELLIESDIVVSYPRGPEYDDARAKLARLKQQRITRVVVEGESIYRSGEFGTSFFTILQGEVTLQTPNSQTPPMKLGRGEFFGETSLLSGDRAENATAGRVAFWWKHRVARC